jgi:sulfite dehydrogenase
MPPACSRAAQRNAGGCARASWADHAVGSSLAERRGFPTAASRRIRCARLLRGGVGGASAQAATPGARPCLFTGGATPPCAICRLEGRGRDGRQIDSLDELRPVEARVAAAFRGGIGAMPSFAATLSDAQIRALARYVAKASGGAP